MKGLCLLCGEFEDATMKPGVFELIKVQLLVELLRKWHF
jgi:hypothetical protein